MLKKFLSGVISAVMLTAAVNGAGSVPDAGAAFDANYAEALQKSLYFYECQQAGPLPDWNRVEWRADSTMIDSVPGGWYDAGDHVKFNLPMAYTASMLAWGIYQYPDGVEKCGQMDIYVNNLTFALDYLAACDLGDEVVYQCGNGQIDHTWWGPVELYQYGMEDSGTSYEAARATLSASEGCSAVFGEMAAALAAGCCALKGKVDSAKLDDYLAHAENIFKFADASKSNDVYNKSDASGFYRSSHFYDDLFYAANWLYMATGDSSYLDKAAGYVPNLDKELGLDEMKYTWCMCWDDVMQGGLLLYAQNTGKYVDRVEKHVNYWTNTIATINGTDVGYCDTWGCLRYAETAAFIAAVACDTVLAGKDTSAYEEFYENQINYVLGDNADNRSYVVGYGENSPKNPHHRTAHGSWKNALDTPDENRHILYGALVGGPKQDGSYEDDRQNYINNEVADDYNAGFTAILCKMIDKYGGECDPAFPEKELRDGPEIYVEASMGKASASGVDLSLKITNHTAWPARVVDNVSYRYYMDLSELIDAGLSPSDVVIRCDRDQAAMYSAEGVKPAEISQPIHYSDNIYYIEVTYPDGRAFLPISEGRYQCELMLALVYPNYGSGWNADNDFSNTDLTDDAMISPYIPVYIGGELYYGTEPDGTSADGSGGTGEDVTKPTQEVTTSATGPVTDTTADSGEKLLYGDADDNGEINVNDTVTVMCFANDPESNKLVSEKAEKQADVFNNGDGINASDAVSIQKYLAHLISELPES